jgi:hypothetical protein
LIIKEKKKKKNKKKRKKGRKGRERNFHPIYFHIYYSLDVWFFVCIIVCFPDFIFQFSCLFYEEFHMAVSDYLKDITKNGEHSQLGMWLLQATLLSRLVLRIARLQISRYFPLV